MCRHTHAVMNTQFLHLAMVVDLTLFMDNYCHSNFIFHFDL